MSKVRMRKKELLHRYPGPDLVKNRPALGPWPLSRNINKNLFWCKTFKKGLNRGW